MLRLTRATPSFPPLRRSQASCLSGIDSYTSKRAMQTSIPDTISSQHSVVNSLNFPSRLPLSERASTQSIRKSKESNVHQASHQNMHNVVPQTSRLESAYDMVMSMRPDAASRVSTEVNLSSPQNSVDGNKVSLLSTRPANDLYWHTIKRWSSIKQSDFLSYRWQVANTVDREHRLYDFLNQNMPERVPRGRHWSASLENAAPLMSRDEFIADVIAGMKLAPMAVRLTPHVLSIIDWANPMDDPIRRQFLPLGSSMLEDHPKLELDSLHESDDSPVPGLVHRYPDKVLFLATSVCPVYCRFCTRSYAIGANTESVTKKPFKPTRKQWEPMFEYIEKNPAVQDVVVSGGDSYYLQPEQLRAIGERLLGMPNVKRIRFATKGLGVCPSRILDRSDGWTDTFVAMSKKGRTMGKQVAMHTHINHPREITWVTEKAARYLFEQGVVVRNQSVLLRNVNDDVQTMSKLIRKLADNNIEPYYVYQGDLVKGVEDLRTPLSVILSLEQKIRGTIAGFMMPSFVVDLPGGGGKRLATSYESYDERSGVSTWKAPGVAGDKCFEYHDPKY